MDILSEEGVADLRKKVLGILKEMSKPLDLDTLIADGVLKESGAWHEMLAPDRIPSHVWKHVRKLEITDGRGRIKITDSSKKARALYEQARAGYERITGQPFRE